MGDHICFWTRGSTAHGNTSCFDGLSVLCIPLTAESVRNFATILGRYLPGIRPCFLYCRTIFVDLAGNGDGGDMERAQLESGTGMQGVRGNFKYDRWKGVRRLILGAGHQCAATYIGVLFPRECQHERHRIALHYMYLPYLGISQLGRSL